jgi:hypothetical protein
MAKSGGRQVSDEVSRKQILLLFSAKFKWQKMGSWAWSPPAVR